MGERRGGASECYSSLYRRSESTRLGEQFERRAHDMSVAVTLGTETSFCTRDRSCSRTHIVFPQDRLLSLAPQAVFSQFLSQFPAPNAVRRVTPCYGNCRKTAGFPPMGGRRCDTSGLRSRRSQVRILSGALKTQPRVAAPAAARGFCVQAASTSILAENFADPVPLTIARRLVCSGGAHGNARRLDPACVRPGRARAGCGAGCGR